MTPLPSYPIRLMIVDDHPMMREGIVNAVLAQGGIDIVAVGANGEEAIALFARHRPDVSLIDLQMPVKDGLEAIVGIRALQRDARIIVLTSLGGDARVVAALKAGAASYLLKDVPGVELAETIRRVYGGASVIAPVAQQEVDGHQFADKLTSRELDVLRLVADGNSNRAIGEYLHISEPTVKSHMSTVMVKLGASDRTHAVTLAIKRGYISL
jgi:two-component system NarL family response regulator